MRWQEEIKKRLSRQGEGFTSFLEEPKREAPKNR